MFQLSVLLWGIVWSCLNQPLVGIPELKYQLYYADQAYDLYHEVSDDIVTYDKRQGISACDSNHFVLYTSLQRKRESAME